MNKKNYDSTVARIAGNIVGHLLDKTFVKKHEVTPPFAAEIVNNIASGAVAIARAIVAEVERTEPPQEK